MALKNITLGKKIASGFISMVVLLIIVSMMSLLGFKSIVENAGEVIRGNQLDGNLAQKEVDHLNWVNKVNALLTDDNKHILDVQTDDHKCGFGKWLYGAGRKKAEKLVPELAPLLKQIEVPHLDLHTSAIKIGQHYKQVDISLGQFLSEKKLDHLMWMHTIKDALLNRSKTLKIQLDPTKCGLGRWIYSDKTKDLAAKDKTFDVIREKIIPFHIQLHKSAGNIKEHMAKSNFDLAHKYYVENTARFAKSTLAALDHAIGWNNEQMEAVQMANQTYAEQTIPALVSIQNLLKQIRTTARKNIMEDVVMLDAARTSTMGVIIMSSVAVILGIVLSFFIGRHITGLLKSIATSIREGAFQVGSAAAEISASSQGLAENASSQAATVEETSASILEISAHSRQTSEMTKGAEDLMSQNIIKSGQSLKAIVDITNKITQIEDDSDKIGMIIKTIDQIAFQTNLLALNAAVEAARAGEAGAGFAVVADEVRNLAIKSTEAARSTQELLDETISRIGEISSSIGDMNDNFEGIVESATEIGEKTQTITTASSELSKGIDQISQATNEIDTVTQQMASNSEESAAASEELNAQAEEMKSIVAELNRMVYGDNLVDEEIQTTSDEATSQFENGNALSGPSTCMLPEK